MPTNLTDLSEVVNEINETPPVVPKGIAFGGATSNPSAVVGVR